MKFLKNTKAFTLVELLAVIVILALIMGIAVVSMNGVIGNVEISSIKSSASAYIDGLRNTLLANMELTEGDYYISDNLLQKTVKSPWGNYEYSADATVVNDFNTKGYSKTTVNTLKCGGADEKGSFVRISKTGNNYNYDICLYDDASNYVYARQTVLEASNPVKTDYYRSGVTAELSLTSDGKLTS